MDHYIILHNQKSFNYINIYRNPFYGLSLEFFDPVKFNIPTYDHLPVNINNIRINLKENIVV